MVRYPGVAVVVAYVLVLTSIAMLVLYVHHIGQSLRVSALIELVGDDTRRQLDRRYPDRIAEQVEDHSMIVAPRSPAFSHGSMRDAWCSWPLMQIARSAWRSVSVRSYRPERPSSRSKATTTRLDRKAAVDALAFGLERTLDEDVAYGFRMLVDMGERAVSEGPFLDPTTAVQTIDRLHDGLRQLAGRRFPDGVHRDASGTMRLLVPDDGVGRFSSTWPSTRFALRGTPPLRSAAVFSLP